MNSQDCYSFDDDNRFVIHQYNDRAPFASFLPGIAGVEGIPAWVFYVNRGQGVASFGVRNKDGAFLEFYPANKAYQLTACYGFRTFLKISDRIIFTTHEPFQARAGEGVCQRLTVSPHEFSVEEIHPGLGLSIRADIFTLPDAPVAGLIRRVTVHNTTQFAKTVEIVDGLPQVLPYGVNQWCAKYMSRTVEAYMAVEGVAENCPYFKLKVFTDDTPLPDPVVAGNFFVGYLHGQRNRVLVDAEKIFGDASDFSIPDHFFSHQPLDFDQQVEGNRTPSAFQALKLELAPGEAQTFYGLYGHAESWAVLQAFLAGVDGESYFEEKREANRRLVEGITQRAFTATANPLFDAYTRQCYLDNGMRGGFSMTVPGGKHLYVFGRKHGDLERDYNNFLVQDSPYSEGNGDFRDVLQNRRMDLFFDPGQDAKNIHYFFNLIQPDGYNPLSLHNSLFIVQASAFARYFVEYPGLETVLSKPVKYAELWKVLRAKTEAIESVITELLKDAKEVEEVEFERGYWSDHWTYLVDLLESYAAIYPDRIARLFHEHRYTFFDPSHFVQPRSKKYIVTPKGVRQTGALLESKEKQALIESRSEAKHHVRDQAGTGNVVVTTLLGKILTLVTNKLASLDPYCVGIEMEADRPGWCDALNGLPGLLGSAVNETIELKRLVDFVLRHLEGVEGNLSLPCELAHFQTGLENLFDDEKLTAHDFWQESHALKESYREQVFMGFAGAHSEQSFGNLRQFLENVSRFLDLAIDRARTDKGIVTYFTYEADEYKESMDKAEVEVTRFTQSRLPLFLEGFVHALRIAPQEEARKLYQSVCDSELFDKKLGMFKVNEPLGENALDLGRIGIFYHGWLENGSVFLHMHYKFVLEMARRGMIHEFYQQIDTLLVAFHDPNQYRRNPIENSSFLVSSGFTVDPREHGRGCVARLSGATVEFLHLWTYLLLGPSPFLLENGRLLFRPQPSLAKAFFSTEEKLVHPFGEAEEILPCDSVACAFLGNTLLVYLNPQRLDTFGTEAVSPVQYQLFGRDGSMRTVEGACLEQEDAKALREGKFRRVDVFLAKR
jgi:hypothetical protein